MVTIVCLMFHHETRLRLNNVISETLANRSVWWRDMSGGLTNLFRCTECCQCDPFNHVGHPADTGGLLSLNTNAMTKLECYHKTLRYYWPPQYVIFTMPVHYRWCALTLQTSIMQHIINANLHAVIICDLIKLCNDKVSEADFEYVRTVLHSTKYDAHLVACSVQTRGPSA